MKNNNNSETFIAFNNICISNCYHKNTGSLENWEDASPIDCKENNNRMVKTRLL